MSQDHRNAETVAASPSTLKPSGATSGFFRTALKPAIVVFVAVATLYMGSGIIPLHFTAQNATGASKEPPSASERIAKQAILTKEQLQQHGGDGAQRLYLAILGDVFDVTKNRKVYGNGGGYGFFTGVDGTKAFVSGQFETDLTDEVGGMTDKDYKGMVGWRDFYYKEYPFVGRLVGAFYDESGAAKPLLREVEEGAARQLAIEERQKERDKQYTRCNVRWSQEDGGVVWCDNDLHPRKVVEEVEGGPPNVRCACFQEVGWSDLRQLYPGCSPQATRCQASPPPDKEL